MATHGHNRGDARAEDDEGETEPQAAQADSEAEAQLQQQQDGDGDGGDASVNGGDQHPEQSVKQLVRADSLDEEAAKIRGWNPHHKVIKLAGLRAHRHPWTDPSIHQLAGKRAGRRGPEAFREQLTARGSTPVIACRQPAGLSRHMFLKFLVCSRYAS